MSCLYILEIIPLSIDSFLPVLYSFDDCSFVVQSEVTEHDTYKSVLLYHSVKNAIGILMGIALNL